MIEVVRHEFSALFRTGIDRLHAEKLSQTPVPIVFGTTVAKRAAEDTSVNSADFGFRRVYPGREQQLDR